MERVHKANLLVILACVLALSVTTIMSYGMSAKSIKGCGVLVAGHCSCCEFFENQRFCQSIGHCFMPVLCSINLFRLGEW